MTARPRKVLLELAVEREFQRIKDAESRGAEAIQGFKHFVSVSPEMGYAVPNAPPGFSSRPFHTDEASYVVIYAYDADTVSCLAIRSVPSPRDTYY